jgi:pyruvate ferredoxin oxidoreductase gamma subunit
MMTEVVWYGRGGQGAFTAARLLGLSASIYGGSHALAFPSFGPERRGAPVFGFTKIDSLPILDRSETTSADYCIVLDETLLDGGTIPLKEGGTLIVNTSHCNRSYGNSFRVVTLDATRLATAIIGVPIVNTALLGAFVAVSNALPYEAAIDGIIAEMKTRADKNITLFSIAYGAVLSGASL